jgi:hypothetical protein
MKINDLLARTSEEIFATEKNVPFIEPLYAQLDRSEPCALYGEITMAEKMVKSGDQTLVCIPCSQKSNLRYCRSLLLSFPY